MAVNEGSESPSTSTTDDDGLSRPGGEDNSTRRQLRVIASGLWHQKPGPRAPRPPRATSSTAVPTKEIVNGLDQREKMFGFGATFIMLASTIAGYTVSKHSPVAHTRAVASDLLIAGLVLGGLMLLGTVLRRRALLGFAAFMTGFEMITGGNVMGVLFLFFGGWLIMRVMRRQKQDRAAGNEVGSLDTKPNKRVSTKAPKPSKRYTPPRNTMAGRRR